MLTKKQQRYTLSLMLLALSCLSSCTMANYNNYCPIYPIAGEKVAKELESAGDLPNTWEWIGRINKLRQELEVCQKSSKLLRLGITYVQ